MSTPSRTVIVKPLSQDAGPRGPRRPESGGGGRSIKPFAFTGLEKVARARVDMLDRLEWLLPEGMLHDVTGEALKGRLKKVLEEDVCLWLDYVHALPPAVLKKIMNDPTVLGVICRSPHGRRGLIEMDLGLAHNVVDMLLGAGAGSTQVRPLTEIEEGVISYVFLELFRALSPPSEDPSYHPLRLERMARSLDEGLRLLDGESAVVIVEFKALFGKSPGFVRLLLPGSVLDAGEPAADDPVRRARRLRYLARNLERLSTVRSQLRVEIGGVQLAGRDLMALRPGDVMLVEELSARVDKGEEGTATLRLGPGQAGFIEASLALGEDGQYQLKLERFVEGPPPPPSVDESGEQAEEEAYEQSEEAPGEEEGGEEAELGEEEGGLEEEGEGLEDDGELADEELAGDDALDALPSDAEFDEHQPTSPGTKLPWEDESENMSDNPEQIDEGAAQLLNDVPLQIVVELGRVPVSAEDVVSLHVGQIIELRRGPGEPVDVSVNGKVIGRGELVEIEGQLGVRIASIAV